MKRKNSLQTKAIFIISFIFTTLIVLVTTIQYINSRKLILSSMKSSGKQTVTIHAQNLSSWVKSRLSQVQVIANTPLVSSMNYNEILPYFEKEQKNYNGVFNSFGISDRQGNLTLQNNVVIDISPESTFPEVMNGKSIISNPFPAKENPSDLIISMECPVRDIKSNKIVGLVSGACLVSTVFEETMNFSVGETDNVYLIHKDGTVLFNKKDISIDENNLLKSSSNEFTDLIKEALTKDGFWGEFGENGETNMLFSSKVEGTDWYMLLVVPTKEYIAPLNGLLYLIIIVTLMAILVLIVLLTLLLRNFFNRLLKISLMADQVAKGDLTTSLPVSQDELGKINYSFNKMINDLKNIILEIRNVSSVVIKSSNSYKRVSLDILEYGEHTKKSIEDITLCTKNTVTEIEDIALSENHMENKSQQLAKISESIDKMISDAKDKTLNGTTHLDSTVKLLYKIKDSVNLTSNVIGELSSKSENIESITTTISEISARTNLLALNANIEAARAGEHGKGFSVVAAEVGELAKQSSEATKEISNEIHLIREQVENTVAAMNDSIHYVDSGTKSIDDILSIFTEIEQEIESIKNVSTNIYAISKSLLEDNKKINKAVTNTSRMCEEAVASTENFQEMINRQENMFLNLKSASEHLDELSASLSGEISRFKMD